jgi:hypothetical protein
MANPGNPGTVIWLGQTESDHGGKSNYFHNWATKFSRLRDTLELVMPYGSTWAIKKGIPLEEFTGELTASLVPSASFERDLGSWTGSNSSLIRVYAKGLAFLDNVTQGTAYCKVTTTRTSGSADKSFGITSGPIPVYSNRGYYTSVAIRPENAASLGTYTLRVDFYKSDGTLINAYDRYVVTQTSLSSNVATLDIGVHNILVGQTVNISGLVSPYNGTYVVTATTTDTISYALTSPDKVADPASGILLIDRTSTRRISTAVINRYRGENYSVTAANITSEVATLTIGSHTFIAGEQVLIMGLEADFNGLKTITSVSSTTLSYDAIGKADITSALTTGMVQGDRWAYLSTVNPGSTTSGASYAILNVTFSPTSFDATQSFGIDRVVFRE